MAGMIFSKWFSKLEKKIILTEQINRLIVFNFQVNFSLSIFFILMHYLNFKNFFRIGNKYYSLIFF